MTPPPLLDLRGDEAADPTTAPVQLLEEHEYGYEWQFVREVRDRVDADPEEVFFPDDEYGTRGRLRTGSATGSLRIALRQNDEVIGALELEVRSRKLNYLSEYRWMLRDIANQMSELVMQRFAATMSHFEIDSGRDAVTLYQRFEFLRSLLCDDRLQTAFNHITHRSHVAWKERTEIIKTGRSVRASSQLMKSMSRAGRRQEWTDGPISSIPVQLPQTRTEATHDTTPNRFVRFALERWYQVVSDIHFVIDRESPNASLSRGLREVAQLLEKLEAMLGHGLFSDVGRLSHFPGDDQVLHRREGYRDFFRAYLEFELAARLSWRGRDNSFAAGQRDVATLYEYWVFLQLAQLIAELTGASVDMSSLLTLGAQGLTIGLRSGRQTIISGAVNRGRRGLLVSFCFNRTFSRTDSTRGSWTIAMRPDYSLTIDAAADEGATFEPVVLHFDAKYKLAKVEGLFEDERSESNGHDERHYQAKNADLLKMHAYRDAIRRSAGAYVVYPGNEDLQQAQQFSQYKEILPGLGAFALRPSEDGTAAGASALRGFLDQAFDHFAERLSRHERGRFWMREAYCRYGLSSGGHAAFAFGEPASDATILLGFVKNAAHWKWIQERMAYNVRTEDRRGGVAANSDLLFSQLVLLYGPEMDDLAVARIVGGPDRITNDDMLAAGYPQPKGDYLCVQVSGLELPDSLTRVSSSDVDGFVVAQGVERGQPISIPWGRLRDALLRK